MQFLYFLPGVSRDSISPEEVIRAGLGDTLRDRMTPTDLSGNGRLIVASVNNGPGGHNGTILQVIPEQTEEPDEDAPAVAIGYFPKQQQWEQVGKYWVGWDPNNLPTPEDLERDEFCGESEVTLGDGRVWMCPVIRLTQGAHRLPDVWKLVNGKFTSVIKPDWAWAWDLTGDIWDWYTSDRTKTQPELFEWAIRLLSINYRVGPCEAGILGLIGSREYKTILYRAIGGLLWDQSEGQKKVDDTPSTANGVSSSAGAGDYTPATPPVGQLST